MFSWILGMHQFKEKVINKGNSTVQKENAESITA